MALVGGEAGSGKTRLARELAHEAAERGTLVLYGAAYADVNVPYQPFVEALEFLMRTSDPGALDESIGGGRDDLARLLPGLRDSAAPPADDPQTARRRLHNAIGELFARVSRERPVLLVVDDIHWADTSSLELLRHLTREAPGGTHLPPRDVPRPERGHSARAHDGARGPRTPRRHHAYRRQASAQ